MIKLANIYKVYENGTVAVRNVSLEFPSCGMVAIVGSSGSGKSTLLNLLSNNDLPSKGELIYNDKRYSDYIKDILLKDFAMIYQDYKLIENLTVYQNIKIGQELATKDFDNDYILSVADKLELTQILDEKVFALSGGQMQRVAIARALVRKPKVIFADEPTGNLDSQNSENVYQILKELSKDILVVIVSHDKAIANYADRVIETQNGKVINDCTGEEYNKIIAEKALRELNNTTERLDLGEDKNKNNTISIKPKKKNKPSKIGSKSVFSYKKGKNKARKKQGLSLNSTIGLTIAFNNKDIAKKVVLFVFTIIMLAAIFFTSAMVFSSQESMFCRVMKQNDVPLVTMNIYSRNYNLSPEEYGKIQDFVKQKTGTDMVPVTNESVLHYMFNKIRPVSASEEDKVPITYNNTLYADDMKDIGVKMLMGEAPKINSEGQDEIVISKSMYNYFKDIKKFKNAEGEIVDFGERALIGDYIKEFRVKITGVFDDKNDIEFVNCPDYFELYLYNDLPFTIIRPKAALKDNQSLNSGISKICLYNPSYGLGFMSGYFYDFCANNSNVKKYYYDYDWLKDDLAKDEIYVSSSFKSYYEWNSDRTLSVGDTLTFDLVRNDYSTGFFRVDETFKSNLTFKVKGIFDIFENTNRYRNDIVINEELFDEYVNPYFDGVEQYAIKSEVFTPKFMKELRNFIYTELSPKLSEIVANDWQHGDFCVEYGMPKYNGNYEYDNDITDLARFCIALPLIVLATISFGLLLVVLISDMVNGKGKELLILRTLGAKPNDLWNLFAGVALVILAVQLIIGCLAGVGLIYGLNKMWTKLLHASTFVKYFYVSPLSILLMAFVVVAVSGGIIWYNMKKLCGKNYRKLFQKQKK